MAPSNRLETEERGTEFNSIGKGDGLGSGDADRLEENENDDVVLDDDGDDMVLDVVIKLALQQII